MNNLSKVMLFSLIILTSCSKCDDDICPGLVGEEIPTLNQCEEPLEDGISEIFKVVENMPLFPGCEDILSKAERKICAEEKMLEFIDNNLVYPESALENEVEGMVVIRFAVDTTGCLRGIQAVRDPGCGLGQEGQRIIYEMPNWNTGRQRGRAVRVQMNIPIYFEL